MSSWTLLLPFLHLTVCSVASVETVGSREKAQKQQAPILQLLKKEVVKTQRESGQSPLFLMALSQHERTCENFLIYGGQDTRALDILTINTIT